MEDGPTQTAEWGGAERWRSRPVASVALRTAIAVAPFATSFTLSWWASKRFPPERLNLDVWVWWMMIAGLAVVVMILTDKFARRFLPLAGLLKLSLVFPDEAPSRFRQALRRRTTTQLAREVEHHRTHGTFTERTTSAEYLLNLAQAVTDHDRLTRGHSERVRAYSDLIAEELGIPDEDREKLHWAALLHDVGKLDVPAAILNKDGPPDEAEWEVLKTHPAAARAYLAPLAPWLGQWIRAADEHHLRWDGRGYPATTAGTDISMAGRIVAVADAFDTMTSVRSYKPAMSAADARTEIARCAGTQFDPAVTRAFLNVGLGRLRVGAGPLGWLGHTLGLESIPLSGATAPVASAAAPVMSNAAMTVGQVALGIATAVGGHSIADGASEPPPVVAFADDPATTTTTTTRPPATTTAVTPTTVTPTTVAPTTFAVTPTAVAPTTTAAPSTTAAPTTTAPEGPRALDDGVRVEEGERKKIRVLENDRPGGSPLDPDTLTIVVAPSHAERYRVQDDHIRYESVENYEGSDRIVYRICDETGLCDTAAADITVYDD